MTLENTATRFSWLSIRVSNAYYESSKPILVVSAQPPLLLFIMWTFNSSFFLSDSIGDCENHNRVSAEGEEEEDVCAQHQEAKHKPLR